MKSCIMKIIKSVELGMRGEPCAGRSGLRLSCAECGCGSVLGVGDGVMCRRGVSVGAMSWEVWGCGEPKQL